MIDFLNLFAVAVLSVTSLLSASASANANADADAPFFASGVKVGEVDQTSAIVWVRLTKEEEARFSKSAVFTEGLDRKAKDKLPMVPDVVPGVTGTACVKYWIAGQTETAKKTDWVSVPKNNDYIHQFKLTDLIAGRDYRYEVTAKFDAENEHSNSITGQFKTAPTANDAAPVKFIVSTCQAIRSIDSGKLGHRAYRQMLDAEPDFFIHTGDILYYDKAPVAKNAELARAKWNLVFAYQHNRQFHQNVSSYFMKDDHDTLKNDCWPGQRYGKLKFEEGLKIFRQQVCMGEKTHRTIRWGRDLQIWLTENRDYRSPNDQPDGPDKTILGVEQKQWLKKSVAESDATFKFIVSPGPIVGPDKPGKNDNHSNAGFQFEGQELRDFIATQKNTYVICGDRHWQYCSRDPVGGVVEFGCGPINDEHNFGGDPGQNERFHRYFSPQGGFFMVSINGDSADAQWFHANDPDWIPGKAPKRLHREKLPISD